MEVWYVPGTPDGPTVLFCHGNSGNLRFPKARGDRFRALHEAGAHLWAFDYRGFGLSSGKPSEQSVYEDAEAVHGLARHYHPQGTPFVLFGRSLGGAVATYLATEIEEPDLLILESTFTSVADVCTSYTHRLLASLMSYRFDSASRMPQLRAPLRMLHGTADQVVPYRLGQSLFELYSGADKEFVTVAGAGHNDLPVKAGPAYPQTLARWLSPARGPG
jgi:pimeloyl-ACP methyl ester carboxylesterase